MYIGRRFRP